ncbi:MAG TPA: universal stress protein [Candidatus Nitrosocosmicus sp.]|nr:universal stress protein [Candidatus Nitrosocosmicus sp.]
MGTRGRSGFKKLLLGGVASGVIAYSTCPVMIVK